jgi:hypothetical protein
MENLIIEKIKREQRAKQIKDAQRHFTLITNYMARFGKLNSYEPTAFEKQNLLDIKKSVDFFVELLRQHELTELEKQAEQL